MYLQGLNPYNPEVLVKTANTVKAVRVMNTGYNPYKLKMDD